MDATLILSALSFLAALGLALLLTPLARRLAPWLGFIDRPRADRFASRAVPRLGGAAIFLAFAAVAPLALAALAGRGPLAGLPGLGGLAGAAGASAARAATPPREFWPVLAGGLVVFVLGLIDDRRALGARLKLVVQTLVAIGLVLAGVRLTIFVPGPWVGGTATVLWILLITNAFNLLDNMDGLSAGVAAVAAAVFFVVALETDQPALAVLLAALVGAAGGFLRYNFHPARIYMGDAGSTFLGFMLAALTVAATFYQEPHPGAAPRTSALAVAMPLVVFAVPIYDTVTVLWIRWREKRPFFVGDRSHFSHRLVALGMSVRAAVLTIYLATLAIGLGATMLKDLSLAGGVIMLAQAAAICAIIASLEAAGRRAARSGADIPVGHGQAGRPAPLREGGPHAAPAAAPDPSDRAGRADAPAADQRRA